MKKFPTLLCVLCLLTGCNTDDDQQTSHLPARIAAVFHAERQATVSSIRQHATEQSTVLCILTDSHLASSVESQDACAATLQNLAYVTEQVPTDGIVHLGDMIDVSLYSREGKTDDQLYTIMGTYMQQLNALHPRTFILNGNHDGDAAARFNFERWQQLAAPLNEAYVQRKAGTPYFYYDVPGKGVRCVFMAVPDNPQPGRVLLGYSAPMLSWLQDEALDVEEGTSVILFAHVPVIHANYCEPPEGRLSGRDSFEGLCRAFNAHTCYADALVDADFTRYHDTRIVAYISGHTHSDLVALPGYRFQGTMTYGDGTAVLPHLYENTLPFPVVIIGRNYYHTPYDGADSSEGGVVHPRMAGTASQDLWDTMIYNKTTGELRFIRFGAGEDRYIKVH